MVFLVWRWPDSEVHTERKAPYVDLAAARSQADHDLARCQAEDDYATVPVRIESEDGTRLWTASIPDGR